MISKLEKEIIIRYLKTRKKDGFLNVISIFSFIGISLGVAVLIIVMSVMNGFRSELVEKIIGFNPHAVVKPNDLSINKNNLKNNDLINMSTNFQFSNSGEAVLINKNYTKGLLLRGYLRNEFKDILEWIDKYTAESSHDASLLDGRLKSGRKIGGKFFLQVMKNRLNEFYNENHNKINVNVTEFVSIFSSLYGERDNQKGTWGADSGLISMVSERDIYNGSDFDRVGFLDKLSGIISDANIISRDYAASPARGNKKLRTMALL